MNFSFKKKIPSRRKERDRQLRQTDILNAAEHVFATRGYHKATIADIAKEAQYAVGTIYLYFTDKEDLYITLIEKKTRDLIFRVQAEVEKAPGSTEKLKVLIETQLAYFEENGDFFHIYFSERGGFHHWDIKNKISTSAVDRFIRYLEYMAGLIRKAQEENLIKKELEPKKMAYILAAILNAIVFPWLKSEAAQKESLKGMAGFVLDVFLEGVRQR